MAVTPDLPPGARSRMWLLSSFTAVVGIATYAVFGRPEILWLTGAVLAILVYLLVGVELTLRRDRATVAAMLERLRDELPKPWLAILDPGGVVLALSDAGQRTLGHTPVLVGQRLADVTVEASRPQLAELLRFASLFHPWDGELSLVAEDGSRRTVGVAALELKDPEARRFGLVAVGPRAPAPV